MLSALIRFLPTIAALGVLALGSAQQGHAAPASRSPSAAHVPLPVPRPTTSPASPTAADDGDAAPAAGEAEAGLPPQASPDETNASTTADIDLAEDGDEAAHATVSTRLAPGMPEIAGGLTYRVYATDNRLRKQVLVAESDSSRLRMVLPPGTWLVEVQHGLARTEKAVALETGDDLRLDLVLDAAYLRVAAVPQPDSSPLEDNLSFEVFQRDGAGLQKVATTTSARPLFKLPADDYVLRTRYRNLQMDEQVTLKAGQFTDHQAVLDLGYLRLEVLAAADNPDLPPDLQFRLHPASNGATRIIDLAPSVTSAVIALPAGRYAVEAESSGNTIERSFVIHRGQVTRATMNLQLAQLEPRVVNPETGAQVEETFTWTVQRLGDELDTPVRAQQTPPGTAFRLAEGRYKLTGSAPSGRAESVISLKEGQDRTIIMQLQPAPDPGIDENEGPEAAPEPSG